MGLTDVPDEEPIVKNEPDSSPPRPPGYPLVYMVRVLLVCDLGHVVFIRRRGRGEGGFGIAGTQEAEQTWKVQ